MTILASTSVGTTTLDRLEFNKSSIQLFDPKIFFEDFRDFNADLMAEILKISD